tara:strand:+ start:538 stop:705 length:168 start_codon:yes stop_codon:yes gene_type:complete
MNPVTTRNRGMLLTCISLAMGLHAQAPAQPAKARLAPDRQVLWHVAMGAGYGVFS